MHSIRYLRSIILSLMMIAPLNATAPQGPLWVGVASLAGGLVCAIPAVKFNLDWIRLTGQTCEHKDRLKELGAKVYENKKFVAGNLIKDRYTLLYPYPCSQEKKEIIDKHFDALVNADKQIGKYILGSSVTTLFAILGIWMG